MRSLGIALITAGAFALFFTAFIAAMLDDFKQMLVANKLMDEDDDFAWRPTDDEGSC